MAEESIAQSSALQGIQYQGGEFAALLNKEFKPKSEDAKSAVEQAVLTLAQQALSQTNLISSDVIASIEAMIAELDRRMSKQINAIMHHEDFQQIESAWRGLHYLVNNTETDEMLKISVMNISKADLAKTLKRYKGTSWDQSPIFKKVYEEEYGQFGGEPFGCLIGDYYFDHSPPDVELLGEMSKVAAASFAPFIAAAAPALMQMSSWQELANPRDLTKIFTTPEYAAWRSLRESDDARYIGLAMPRFLSRLPYGAKTSPVEEFDFEEETGGGEHGNYTWANSAYAMAVNINRAFKLYGWCSRIRGIESGGARRGPAYPHLPDRRGRCGDEVPDRDRDQRPSRGRAREERVHAAAAPQELRLRGLHWCAVAAEALRVRRPRRHRQRQPLRTAAVPCSRCCRFAHYLKCIVRDKIGSFKERSDMAKWLNNWIMNYVDGDPANSSETTKAQKPLAAAEVSRRGNPGQPGLLQRRSSSCGRTTSSKG